jgi:hypothetical protein
MKARKQAKGGARKRPCPVHALAVEASKVIAAMNLIEKRQLAKQELPLDEMTAEGFRDRLDAIQVEASYREPSSHDGAAFMLAVAGATHDLLSSSTFADEREREKLERLAGRLIDGAREYLIGQSTDAANRAEPAWMEWLSAAEYFCGAEVRRVAKAA